jgi:hypothetical protein
MQGKDSDIQANDPGRLPGAIRGPYEPHMRVGAPACSLPIGRLAVEMDAADKGLGADSEEKHEPVSDIDIVVVVKSLKALDPGRPIREVDIACAFMSP